MNNNPDWIYRDYEVIINQGQKESLIVTNQFWEGILHKTVGKQKKCYYRIYQSNDGYQVGRFWIYPKAGNGANLADMGRIKGIEGLGYEAVK